MIIWKVIYSKEAIDYLSKLPIKIRKRILDKIKFFRLQENPLKYAKKLKNCARCDFYHQVREEESKFFTVHRIGADKT